MDGTADYCVGLFARASMRLHGNGKGQKVCRVWLSKPGGVLREAFMLVVLYVMYVCIGICYVDLCLCAGMDSRELVFAVYCVHAPQRVRRCKFLCVCIKVCSVVVGSVGDGGLEAEQIDDAWTRWCRLMFEWCWRQSLRRGVV